jgi:hypothetical protein
MELAREQFTLICRSCAALHTREMAWVQSHSFLRCDKCGVQQPIDKDAAMIELANREINLQRRERAVPALPARPSPDSPKSIIVRHFGEAALDRSDA